MNIPYLNQLFQPGAQLQSGPDTLTVSTVDAGMLVLPGGQIIAADPFAGADTPALTHRVDPGQYPVTLSMVRYAHSPYDTIAAARLRIADSPAVTWQPAHTSGNAGSADPDEIYGYPVDSGNGAFMSPESARQFGRNLGLLGAVNFGYIREVSAAAQANAPNGGPWVNLVLEDASGANAILFQSGFGDGVYASYWGYDGDENLVCLVTDFGLFEIDIP